MQAHSFPNQGWVESQVQPQYTDIIWREVRRLGTHSPTVDHGHVGTVTEEYRLVDPETRRAIQAVIEPLIEHYVDQHSFALEDRALQLGDTWCNLQHRGEYFIPHTHRGVFSFALWLQVPFTQAEEQAHRSKPGREVSGFSFHYTDSLGRIRPLVLPVDRSWENRIVVFPAEMTHSVSPFYSTDQTRITVSGNVIYGQ